jgi:plasmid maintenance system killer protein
MIVNFGSTATEDIYHGLSTRASRSVPVAHWPVIRRKLDMINVAHALEDLRLPLANALEELRGTLTEFNPRCKRPVSDYVSMG